MIVFIVYINILIIHKKIYTPMKNALRLGLENMGFRFPKFNFTTPVVFLDIKEKNVRKNPMMQQNTNAQKIFHRKHGTDRRN